MLLPKPANTERGRRTPAVRALGIQLAAAVFTFLGCVCLQRFADLQPGIGSGVLAQGVLAAALCIWRRLAWWWALVELLFPVALLMTLALHLPPVLFLLAFLFLLALYWSTFRTQVPFYPSGAVVWRTVLTLLPSDRPVRLIDIGSGLGGLVLYLASHRPDSQFIGIELAPLPWLISIIRARTRANSAGFIRGDYDRLDFGSFDVIFAYLSPAAMPALWLKAQREMQPGALLLSYEFPIPGHVADLTVLPHPQGAVLYGWRR